MILNHVLNEINFLNLKWINIIDLRVLSKK